MYMQYHVRDFSLFLLKYTHGSRQKRLILTLLEWNMPTILSFFQSLYILVIYISTTLYILFCNLDLLEYRVSNKLSPAVVWKILAVFFAHNGENVYEVSKSCPNTDTAQLQTSLSQLSHLLDKRLPVAPSIRQRTLNCQIC